MSFIFSNSEELIPTSFNRAVLIIVWLYYSSKSICVHDYFVVVAGPCGGKTTGQARLFTFFENLGWKVSRSNRLTMCLSDHCVTNSANSSSVSCKYNDGICLRLQIVVTVVQQHTR